MSVFKSTFDAIGSGAGVAWPSFGILSAALTLGIGGAAIAGLGSVCCGLFLLVSLRVFYLSYKKAKNEETQLNEKLTIHLLNFIDELHRRSLKESHAAGYDFLNYLHHFDIVSANQKSNIQQQFLEFIKKNSQKFLCKYGKFSTDQRKEKLKEIIDHFIESSTFEQDILLLPDHELLNHAFLSFVGVFGAAAGSSGGIIGVLVGLGFITGLGAVPILGGIILGTAIFLGLCGAIISIHSNIEKNKKIQICKSFKAFNRNFMAEMKLESPNPNSEQLYEIKENNASQKMWGAPVDQNVVVVQSTLFHHSSRQHGDSPKTGPSLEFYKSS